MTKISDKMLVGEAEGAELALRPCPFCGGSAELVDGGGGAWRAVECGTCGARGRRAADVADAARAWNIREADRD